MTADLPVRPTLKGRSHGPEGLEAAKPKVAAPLDPGFRPLVLANHAFRRALQASGQAVPVKIGLEREDGHISIFEAEVFEPGAGMAARSGDPEGTPSGCPRRAAANLGYLERMVKTLLWQRGGWRVILEGPKELAGQVRAIYSPGGARAFDADFMGGVYEHPFSVEPAGPEGIPQPYETPVLVGRHLEGCRIGFDAGASDRKVAAVIDGEPVYSEEVVWDPRNQGDPEYHHREISAALKSAAARMPRVDAIGVSAAGIYIQNRVRVASLFRGVPKDLFERKVRDLFLRVQQEWGGVPLAVVNDGEVSALAGAMTLNDTAVLGLALGSSEAGGYVDTKGSLTTRLNELAFVPIDVSPDAAVDEWSGESGVGAQYLSQMAVVRLAPAAGIELDPKQTPAEQLQHVQGLLAQGDDRARRILETIGVYLGYAIAHYADFYHFRHVLVLGRVTSGQGGPIVLERAQQVLDEEFPELAARAALHLPDELGRRVGQAVAAASLPALQ